MSAFWELVGAGFVSLVITCLVSEGFLAMRERYLDRKARDEGHWGP